MQLMTFFMIFVFDVRASTSDISRASVLFAKDLESLVTKFKAALWSSVVPLQSRPQ
jgi:hypothetical protein